MGDPRTTDGQAVLKAASPLFKADAIKRPLLIGQGANDPRVNQREAGQIVAAMKAKNIPVTYILFPDEGHGFARPENNIAFYAASEQFLAKCAGRAEPMARLRGLVDHVPYGGSSPRPAGGPRSTRAGEVVPSPQGGWTRQPSELGCRLKLDQR